MAEKQFNNTTEFIFSNEFIGFTTIPNYIFNDRSLSFKAVGIYCSILQFQNSPTHSISIKGLMAVHSDGERSVTSGINELLDAGFLTREQIREKGQIKGYIYTVYMKPVKVETIDNASVSPKLHFADTENADMENVVNKKKICKKENLKKENNTTGAPSGAVVSQQEEIILKDTNIKELTSHQKEKVAAWNIATLNRAIKIYNAENGLYFKLLEKIYNDGAITSLTQQKHRRDVNKGLYQHNWDFSEMERLEQEYIDRKLAAIGK